jgi:hypothetical protein
MEGMQIFPEQKEGEKGQQALGEVGSSALDMLKHRLDMGRTVRI